MNKLYLVGFMGAGKSTVGKILSRSLGYVYIDLDSFIEEKSGRSLSDIFAESGEDYFRGLETDCLSEVSENSEKNVISTGGGVVLNPLNRDKMKKSGVTIYLRARLETIWERVKDDKNRPLLRVDNPYEKAKELLEERKELYEKSDIIIDTDNMTPGHVSEKITGFLFK